jgi:hypothetical protein
MIISSLSLSTHDMQSLNQSLNQYLIEQLLLSLVLLNLSSRSSLCLKTSAKIHKGKDVDYYIVTEQGHHNSSIINRFIRTILDWMKKRNRFETLRFASLQDIQQNQTSNNNSITSTNGEQYEPWRTEYYWILKETKQNRKYDA